MSRSSSFRCPRCGRLLIPDPANLEWFCPPGGCARRWQTLTVDPGPPIRLGPPIDGPRVVADEPPEPVQVPPKPARILVPGLRDIRKARGMRQEDLARQIGVTKVAVCHWESCRYAVSANTVGKLTALLGVQLSCLTKVQPVS